MAIIRPFQALRPPKHLAAHVASVPYDVVNTEEALKLASNNQYSFLHVSRPEIDLAAGTDLHSNPVYAKAKENFQRFISSGVLKPDTAPCFYLYAQKMGNRTQTGLVALTSVDDYDAGTIKIHEKTRKDKEDDRTRHILELNAAAEPVLLIHGNNQTITAITSRITKTEPEYEFTSPDAIGHTLWIVKEPADIAALSQAFSAMPLLYVADGHHRSASASRVRRILREKNPAHTGNELYNFFLSVIFPESQLAIMPYNRVVMDLNGNDQLGFLKKISEKFTVEQNRLKAPTAPETFSMYLSKKWYMLVPRKDVVDHTDPYKSLDVSILQDTVLQPILGIDDPRISTRIDFVGGIRGTLELERLVDSGKFSVAFSLYPVTVQQLMNVADAGMVMPPKSTWFEPKLRSGLFVHVF